MSSSLTPPKPVPCKGCGKPIIFEKQQDGKWLVSEYDVDEGVKLEKHNCPSYKPKPKEATSGGWTGTNKQGQMFEARVHEETNRAQMEINNIILKMLTDSSQLLEQRFHELNERTKRMEEMLQVIYVAGKYDQATAIEQPKTAAQEMTDATSHEESDYIL